MIDGGRIHVCLVLGGHTLERSSIRALSLLTTVARRWPLTRHCLGLHALELGLSAANEAAAVRASHTCVVGRVPA